MKCLERRDMQVSIFAVSLIQWSIEYLFTIILLGMPYGRHVLVYNGQSEKYRVPAHDQITIPSMAGTLIGEEPCQ
jgi:hypothetical protein